MCQHGGDLCTGFKKACSLAIYDLAIGVFDKERYRAVEAAFRALRDGNKELKGIPDTDDVNHLREWLAAKSKYGIYGFAGS